MAVDICLILLCNEVMNEEKPLVSPEAATTWATDNKSIHSPDFATMGAPGTAQAGEVINPGLVVDVNAARDIANVQNEHGNIAAQAREGELQKQAETGLNESERKNLELMDGVVKIFPDAFEEKMDEKGRKILFMVPTKEGETGSVFQTIMTLSGTYIVNMNPIGGPKNVDSIDWAVFIDKAKSQDYTRGRSGEVSIDTVVKDVWLKENTSRMSMTVYKNEMMTEEDIRRFNESLNAAQTRGEEAKRNVQKTEEETSASNILASLKRNNSS